MNLLEDYANAARPFVARIMGRGGSLQSRGMPWQAGVRPNTQVAQSFDALGPQASPLWSQMPAGLQPGPAPSAGFQPQPMPQAPQPAPLPPQAPFQGPAEQSSQPQNPGLLDQFLRAIYDKGSRGLGSEPTGPRVGPFAR